MKRLTRDVRNGKLGGVCSGLANYFEIDVSIVRVAWIIFVLAAGSGLLAYLLCWIVIPAE